ncbi:MULTISPECIES: formyltransferase family protein [Pseudomonas]|uniref:Formyl transferase family protein n=1 Tax=Pseudomonas fluorescens (strain Q2-87) TaxID=1038922 RepID=J2EMS9_PSEFQ|nr:MULTISPECIES: formyltransferase family protein [Pseudomonas]EJL04930.1 formyl transferase family protein [Pseudomonas fluorescens Q2-87]
MPRNVVICGKGELAIFACNYFDASPDHIISYVVADPFEPVSSELTLIQYCRNKGIPLIESGKIEDLPGYKEGLFSCDLCLVIFHKRILPRTYIDCCKRIVNLHLSYLPQYRGVRPVNWALKNGERQHGVTLHEINEGIDDGPILNQVSFCIYPEFEEVIDTYNRAICYARQLLIDTLPLLDTITPFEQRHEEKSIYFEKDNARLEERMTFTREQSLKMLGRH